ncbi:hypothetical protein [Tenacibaculum retecalamus]|uniref:hypothetical protein n=1 Tax=Tenacibaculum retecalamus TaxID=3018315 RepID=UPI0023D95CBF|nr:hypothetical protein [Tenacibaculum retecalamus]WBX70202.1 hypothetical protein PG912_07840 [Tenacibaculum retecalamus]
MFFISIKASGLHALSHSESDFNFNDCDLCEFVTSNDIPLETNNKIDFEPIILKNYNSQPQSYYHYLFTDKQVNNALFCRPPPTF